MAARRKPAESGTPPTISEDRADRKLSEVARKLVIPTGIAGSYWPAVRETCNERMGIYLDRWQDGIAGLALAYREDGVIAHTVGGFGLSVCRQVGKAVDIRTPLLTTTGWVTAEDIRVGYEVIHPSGRPVAVTEVHPIRHNRDCYEVTTTDGRSIVVDAEHLWTVTDKRREVSCSVNGKRVRQFQQRTLTTKQLLDEGLSRYDAGSRGTTLNGKDYQTNEYRFTLPRQECVDLPERNLPIDPYLFGAWLGDGTTTAAHITCHLDDVEHWQEAISAAGFEPKRYEVSVGKSPRLGIPGGLRVQLRKLGVLGNKHIPESYLLGSPQQRLALLQGLLDTDGCIDRRGIVEFTSTTRDLADGVLFLVRSLGWRAALHEGKATLDGRDCGPKYRVTFTPKLTDGMNPFRMPRKAERVQSADGGKGRFTVSIRSIEKVATRPVRCIKVDSDDGLFLAGRDLVATHNTHTLTALTFGMAVEYPGLLGIWTSHHVKALACDTPLLTANRGWTTMGEAQVGDEVVHPSGSPTKVIQVSDVFLGNDCYEVETTDGRKVIADAGHLWTVTDLHQQGSSGSGANRKRWILPPVTMTTEQLVQCTLSYTNKSVTNGRSYQTPSYRFRLPEQSLIDGLPEKDLPIDPYLFGAWLGDGTSKASALTCSAEDMAHWCREIGKAGYLGVARKYPDRAWRVAIRATGGNESFLAQLKKLGVFNNKHIPDEYLTGSAAQRLALLQGLMDTDGGISKAGTCTFTSAERDLTDGVLLLARSLGWRAKFRECKSKLNGVEYKPVYQAAFTPRRMDGIAPFRLERKLARISASTANIRRGVSIKSITRVASVPTRCIKVAAPDGLFLAGRDLIPTHNTNSESFQAVQAFCNRERVKPFIKKVILGSGDEAVEFVNGSRILFGARERGFGRGIPGVDILMSDEAQILSQRAMQDMLATLNTSRIGLHIYVGTPPKPSDNSEMFSVMRREAWSGEATDLAWVECSADDDADIDDPDQWMKANPSCPHRTPVVSIQRLRRRLDDSGFRREALGIWDSDEASAFDLAAWSDLADRGAEAPSSAAVVIDMSPDRKHCWIGVAGEIDTDNGSKVLLMATEVKARDAVPQIQKLIDSRTIVEVSITGGAARSLEPALVEANIEYKRLSQTDMAASYSTMQEAIKNATICHLDQEDLNTAMAMTRTRFIVSGESEVFDRRSYSVDVSPAVACSCALYRYGMAAAPMPVLL